MFIIVAVHTSAHLYLVQQLRKLNYKGKVLRVKNVLLNPEEIQPIERLKRSIPSLSDVTYLSIQDLK